MSEFTRRPNTLDGPTVESNVKRILGSKIFLGTYVERRYVAVLRQYRDVVIVSNAETELKNDMEDLRGALETFYGVKWIGITEPSSGFGDGHCFWVNLNNVPFGHYWFQVRQAKFDNGEVIVRLKCIRASHADDKIPHPSISSAALSEKTLKVLFPDRHEAATSDEYKFDFDPAEMVLPYLRMVKDAIVQIYFNLTAQNIIWGVRVSVATTIAIITLVFAFIRYVGEYFLTFIREMSHLVKAATPITLQIIDMVTKMIGGLYILLAMMWRGEGNRQQHAGSRRPMLLPARHTPSIDIKSRLDRNKQLRQDLKIS